MKPVFLTVVVVVLTAISLSETKGGCKYGVTPVNVDAVWFDKVSEGGWEGPIGSKVESNLDVGAGIPIDNSTLRTKRCYMATVKTPLAPFDVPADCRYDNVNQQTCALKTKGTPAESIIKLYGDFNYTLTDNSTYLVEYGCLMKNKVFWAVLIPKGETLTEETEAKILAHIKDDLKLSTDPKDLKSDSDPVQFTFATGGSCAKKQKKPAKGIAGVQTPGAAGGALDGLGRR